MDKKGYYKILEVPENATDEQIKSSYKKMALKWHPDRWVNGTEDEKKTAEDKFKQLNEAYSVLSDKEKRNAYDMGMDGNFQAGGPGFNPFDIFKQHFGNMGGFGINIDDLFNDDFDQGMRPNDGNDVNVSVAISMAEANNGTEREITYEIHDKCEHCNGTGLGDGGSVENCPHCKGTGKMNSCSKMGFATIRVQTTCPHCKGTGKVVKNPCKYCGGTGLGNMKKVTRTISIPVGMAPGESMQFIGLGDAPENSNGVNGNLNVKVNVMLPNGYSFCDNFGGVEYEMEIPFYDAMLGCETEVMFPSGEKRKIPIRENTADGTEYRFANEGMRLKDGRARSPFIVTVRYARVKNLTDRQKELLKEFKNTTENGN